MINMQIIYTFSIVFLESEIVSLEYIKICITDIMRVAKRNDLYILLGSLYSCDRENIQYCLA